MKQSFNFQLIVDEDEKKSIFSYRELGNALSLAGFEVELVQSPGCKSGVVFYLKRKSEENSSEEPTMWPW